MTEKPQILIVDDLEENLFTLKWLLKALDAEVYQAESGAEALKLTLDHEFCVALVDIQMPEMDGYELVELLRSNEMTATLPVIFVSAIYSDEFHHRKAYDAGAIDFINKPFIPEILISKVKFFIELYQQRQALQQANLALTKLNSDKDNFFASVSHELQNPINALLDNAQLMVQETDQLSYAQVRGLGQQNYTSALTIYSLIETLMTWSTMQRIHLKQPFAEINLRNLAYQAVEVWREMTSRKNIELLNDIEEEVYVYGDEMMLATILRNLLANGLKYTLSGDQVTLSARLVETGGQDQERTRPSLVTISVTDTGTGISPESLAQLFRVNVPHTTPGTAQETGAGLGLIMCKEMVEYQGGRLWIESKLGQGTTVYFTVPLAADFARYL